MTALDQPFAAIGVTDLYGCNQVGNSNIDCTFVYCLADFFGVFSLDKSGLAHGDGWIDQMTTMGRMNVDRNRQWQWDLVRGQALRVD